jgi:hypothetical protein
LRQKTPQTYGSEGLAIPFLSKISNCFEVRASLLLLFEVSREVVVVSMFLQRGVGSFVKWRPLSLTLVNSSQVKCYSFSHILAGDSPF